MQAQTGSFSCGLLLLRTVSWVSTVTNVDCVRAVCVCVGGGGGWAHCAICISKTIHITKIKLVWCFKHAITLILAIAGNLSKILMTSHDY